MDSKLQEAAAMLDGGKSVAVGALCEAIGKLPSVIALAYQVDQTIDSRRAVAEQASAQAKEAEGRLVAVRAELDKITPQYEAMKAEYASVTAQRDAVKAEAAQLQAEATRLRAAVESLSAQHADVTGKLAAVKAALA